MGFGSFLKRIDVKLFNEYKLERLASEDKTQQYQDKSFASEVRFDIHQATEDFGNLRTISSLPWNHPAKVYIQERQIPNYWHSQIRWVDKFQTWVNNVMLPGKYDDLTFDEGRLVIPFLNEKKKLFAYLGRAISNNEVRYMLNVLDHSEPLVWGRSYVDLKKRKKKIIVTEGPIDAMFMCGMSMNGGNFTPLLSLGLRERSVLCFDNEPRSSSTKKKMIHAIENGFNICIWPETLQEKDINEIIKNGTYTSEELFKVIDAGTCSGTTAKINLQKWSRVG